MPQGQHDVERATAGLVMALFLASALLLAAMLYFVMRDIEERTDSETESPQAVRLHEPPVSPVSAHPVPTQPTSSS